MIRAIVWLFTTTIGRWLLGAALASIAGLVGYAWLKINYVPRADYRALEQRHKQAMEVLAERDAALESDAELAERDAVRIRELEELVNEQDVPAGGPIVWDRDAIERMQALRR